MIELGPRSLKAIAMVSGAVVAIVAATQGVDGLLLSIAGGLVGYGIGAKISVPKTVRS